VALPIQIQMTEAAAKSFLVDDINKEWRKGRDYELSGAWDAEARDKVLDADGVAAESALSRRRDGDERAALRRRLLDDAGERVRGAPVGGLRRAQPLDGRVRVDGAGAPDRTRLYSGALGRGPRRSRASARRARAVCGE
jgi:hypothetical protein